MRKIITAVFGVCLCFCASAQILDLAGIVSGLPLLPEPGDRINYEGSIDPEGRNRDYDWYRYQDANGEWVLMEAEGPGELLNFVQHRYVSDGRYTDVWDDSFEIPASFLAGKRSVRISVQALDREWNASEYHIWAYE